MQELVAAYKELVLKNIPIDDQWDEELNNIAHVRQLIHENIDSIDKKDVQKLDQQWQSHILQTTHSSLSFTYPRDGVATKYWWAWIDKLANISLEERATL
jgi:hypothetical protein